MSIFHYVAFHRDTYKTSVAYARNLEVLNLETNFFGDMEYESRWADMLCDGKVQYNNYSVQEMCPMWGMWVKEGENEIKALREIVGGGGE